MTTRQKILLDRAVGTPLAWGTNVVARILGKVLARDHSTDPAGVRHVVVQKLLGLGSIVQATPLLTALKTTFPHAQLTLLTAARNRPLVERLPVVDRGLYVDDDNVLALGHSTLGVVRSLLAERVDFFFDLELYSAAASVLSALSCARNRYGFYWHSAGFKKNAYTHIVKFGTNKPVARLYLQLGLAAGTQDVPIDRLGPIAVSAADRRSLAETLRTAAITLPGEYVVVNPNASDLLYERRWPADRFVTLLEHLAREGRCTVLIGDRSERAYVDGLVRSLGDEARRHVVDTSGRLTLGELMALIASAACVVTNDTGPMHLAFALGRPTVCLFGPVDPLHYGFDTANVETLYVPVFCSPCVHENENPPCGGNNVCMQLIEPDHVLAAVHRLLHGAAAPRPPIRQPRYVDFEGRALGIIARVSLPPSQPATGRDEAAAERPVSARTVGRERSR